MLISPGLYRKGKMEKHGKIKRKKLLVLLAVVLGFAAAYVAYFLILEYKVHSKAREIRSGGYPASPEELEKWYVEPPLKNAAPIYEEAFGKICARPENVDEKNLMVCGSAEIPPVGTAIPGIMMENAKAYLVANAKSLELIHKAAEAGTCRFPVEISDAERSLAYHSKLRQAARLLYLQTVVATEEGDVRKAFDAALDSCKLSRSLENEPLPDSLIIQMALEHYALDSVERLISKGCLDENQLKLIGQETASFEQMRPLERAYAGERSLVLSEYYLEEFMEYAIYDFPGFVRKSPFMKKTVFFLFDASCLRQLNNLSCIGFFAELVDLAKGKPENMMKSMENIESRIKTLPWYLFAVRIYMPHLCAIAEKKIILVSRARVVRTAAAIEAYKIKNGKVPDSLSMLVPGQMGEVPADPVDGGSIRYFKTEKGFLVYSTGADGMENYGNPGSNRGFSAGEDFSINVGY